MTTAEAPVVSERFEVDLDDVESTLRKLLRSYRIALQFAADMPLLGRSVVEGRTLRRWGSRPFTRVYVETHVRKHLQAIRDCLRLERLGRQEDAEKERIAALEEELEENLAPLFRWRHAVGLLARLPPLAAVALPILSAASLVPSATDVSRFTLFVVISLIALGFWILVVWPSIRLGFRVKRVIFTGGVDLEHPFWARPQTATWTGFASPAFYDDEQEGRQPKSFPPIEVYDAENAAYRALRRSKRAEVPLDLLFSIVPYFWFAYSAFFIWGLIDSAVDGDLWQTIKESNVGLVLAAGFAIVWVTLVLQGRRTYHNRPH